MAFDPSSEWLSVLADPDTHEPVELATDAQCEALRQAIASGRARRRDGEPATTDFEAAFLTRQGRCAYLVLDGIPNFLIEERIELEAPLARSL